MNLLSPLWWSAPCPSYCGPVVFRLVGEKLVGTCADLEVACYWSDTYRENQHGWVGTTGELVAVPERVN